jgi:hypothetical protein
VWNFSGKTSCKISNIHEVVDKFCFRGAAYEDGRWMELAQDNIQWRTLVLAVLNFDSLNGALVTSFVLYVVN